MPKRRSHHRTHHRRRRRVGALALGAGSPAKKLLAVAGGYFVAADPINAAVDSTLSKMKFFQPAPAADGTVPAGLSDMGNYTAIAIEALGGYMLLKKRGLVGLIGGGLLAGAALKRALKKFGVISGFQTVPVIGAFQSVPVIGRPAWPNQLSGYRVPAGQPASMNGFTVPARPASVMGSAMDRGATSDSGLLG